MHRSRAVPVALALALALAACRPSPAIDEQQVTDALDAVAAWLAVDDAEVSVDQAADRARTVVADTAPLVEARAPIEGLDDAQTQAFYDALADLRESVAQQAAVLEDCDGPDPGTCLARSDLDPAQLAEAVERFQDATAPLGPSAPDARAAVTPGGPAAPPGAAGGPAGPGAPPVPGTRTRPSR